MISDRINPEQAAMAADLERERAKHKEMLQARGMLSVVGLVASNGLPERDRIVLCKAILAEAARQFIRAQDAPALIAHLGKLAAEHGGELRAPRADLRRAAERVFNARHATGRDR